MRRIGFGLGRLSAAVLGLGLLWGCAELALLEPQIPGRRGLVLALGQFEAAARRQDWDLLLLRFYLPDHEKDVEARYNGNVAQWFRDGLNGAVLGGTPPARLCVLAMRETRVSPRFSPHYVVYYRVQKRPCQEQLKTLPPGTIEGRMEWGYEVKERRWVHLRRVG